MSMQEGGSLPPDSANDALSCRERTVPKECTFALQTENGPVRCAVVVKENGEWELQLDNAIEIMADVYASEFPIPAEFTPLIDGIRAKEQLMQLYNQYAFTQIAGICRDHHQDTDVALDDIIAAHVWPNFAGFQLGKVTSFCPVKKPPKSSRKKKATSVDVSRQDYWVTITLFVALKDTKQLCLRLNPAGSGLASDSVDRVSYFKIGNKMSSKLPEVSKFMKDNFHSIYHEVCAVTSRAGGSADVSRPDQKRQKVGAFNVQFPEISGESSQIDSSDLSASEAGQTREKDGMNFAEDKVSGVPDMMPAEMPREDQDVSLAAEDDVMDQVQIEMPAEMPHEDQTAFSVAEDNVMDQVQIEMSAEMPREDQDVSLAAEDDVMDRVQAGMASSNAAVDKPQTKQVPVIFANDWRKLLIQKNRVRKAGGTFNFIIIQVFIPTTQGNKSQDFISVLKSATMKTVVSAITLKYRYHYYPIMDSSTLRLVAYKKKDGKLWPHMRSTKVSDLKDETVESQYLQDFDSLWLCYDSDVVPTFDERFDLVTKLSPLSSLNVKFDSEHLVQIQSDSGCIFFATGYWTCLTLNEPHEPSSDRLVFKLYFTQASQISLFWINVPRDIKMIDVLKTAMFVLNPTNKCVENHALRVMCYNDERLWTKIEMKTLTQDDLRCKSPPHFNLGSWDVIEFTELEISRE